jgi:hypothetical protein
MINQVSKRSDGLELPWLPSSAGALSTGLLSTVQETFQKVGMEHWFNVNDDQP